MYQGNVFDMASLQLLAIKAKTWRDLVSDEPFKREDIITIQVRDMGRSVSLGRSGALDRQSLTMVGPLKFGLTRLGQVRLRQEREEGRW